MARCRETGSGGLGPWLLLLLCATLGRSLPPAGTSVPELESMAEMWKSPENGSELLHNWSLALNMTRMALRSLPPVLGLRSMAELWGKQIVAELKLLHNESQFFNMTRDEIYKSITSWCWEEFREWMLGVPGAQLCEWRVISRPYSNLRDCLETLADKLNYSDGYPNGIADKFIVLSHHTYFLNCTQEHPVFLDPPEDLLLALIFAPICLIPFLVTLVVWRSKDSKMQA
ncbi:receptor activity-modifying protein 2 isoform X2 [Pelodiscus sinensis]|uniref:receptor activity-modifying protein 2 isoform X2 n=1 Tax=Pelodiscus sinensis TaxID=13735 RepID=UPI003F6B735C